MNDLQDPRVPADRPLACSLDASDLPARLAEIAALGREALVASELDGARARLRFAGGTGVCERVSALLAAERECCAFLAFTLHDGGDAVVVDVTAPAGADAVLREWVAAFGPAPRLTA